LTEAELKAYTGADKSKPIYLAINGTIFDVSSSPAFYGPGGHYNHFTGKDATRAWVTECWDTDDQFTWRLEDIHRVLETLDHWYNFFWNNDKYKVVGTVIRDEEGTPKTPPAPCAE
ncbi:hypothetical protein CERZMDRAFT_5661, partial [Cercospora zeae-maydis SCOH1-5]